MITWAVALATEYIMHLKGAQHTQTDEEKDSIITIIIMIVMSM